MLHDPPLGALGPRRRQLAAVEARNHRALASVLRRFDPDVVSVWHMGGLSLSLLHQLRLRRRPTVLVVCDGWPLYAPPTDPLCLAGAAGGARPDGRHRRRRSAATRCAGGSRRRRRRASPTARWRGSASTRPTSHPVPVPPAAWRGRLLYVGRIDAEKGVFTLVRALAHLPPDTTLEVLGRGSPDALAELERLAATSGGADRITVAARPRHELAERYAAADAVVFPSEWEEPFGIVPLEAMASATPVVATGTGGSGEYLRDGVNCLLFPPGDPVALAERGRPAGGRPGAAGRAGRRRYHHRGVAHRRSPRRQLHDLHAEVAALSLTARSCAERAIRSNALSRRLSRSPNPSLSRRRRGRRASAHTSAPRCRTVPTFSSASTRPPRADVVEHVAGVTRQAPPATGVPLASRRRRPRPEVPTSASPRQPAGDRDATHQARSPGAMLSLSARSPTASSMSSRTMSACPACRFVSAITWTRIAVQRHLAAVVGPPRHPADRVQRQRLDGGVGVRPRPPVEVDDLLAGLLGGRPHVGVGLGVVVQPGHGSANGRPNVSPK